MAPERFTLIAKVFGAVWPVLCALMTSSTLLLVRAYASSAIHRQIDEPLWWLSGLLTIAGSVAAGVYSARDNERGKAAVAFAAWSAFWAFMLPGIYSGFMNERQ